jgi:hypothetical protein
LRQIFEIVLKDFVLHDCPSPRRNDRLSHSSRLGLVNGSSAKRWWSAIPAPGTQTRRLRNHSPWRFRHGSLRSSLRRNRSMRRSAIAMTRHWAACSPLVGLGDQSRARPAAAARRSLRLPSASSKPPEDQSQSAANGRQRQLQPCSRGSNLSMCYVSVGGAWDETKSLQRLWQTTQRF